MHVECGFSWLTFIVCESESFFRYRFFFIHIRGDKLVQLSGEKHVILTGWHHEVIIELVGVFVQRYLVRFEVVELEVDVDWVLDLHAGEPDRQFAFVDQCVTPGLAFLRSPHFFDGRSG